MNKRTDSDLAVLRVILDNAEYPGGNGKTFLTLPEQIEMLEAACLREHAESARLHGVNQLLQADLKAANTAKSTPPPAPSPTAPAKAVSAQGTASGRTLFGLSRTAAAIRRANP